jgi:hypothetical protein
MRPKSTIVFVILAVLVMAGIAHGEPIPTGVASWYDSTTGNTSRAFSGGGEPVLNYQKADSSWDFIIDDWVQIGERQLWKSVRGNHRAWADSLGATIYAKGNHYLGMDPPKLGRFKKTDSSWTLLSEFEPDSVRVDGGTITYWGAYHGTHVRAVNNAKVFQVCTPYEFEFTQEFRDSAANMPAGFWQDALIATAIPLVVDSLNLTLHTRDGVLNWDIKGKPGSGHRRVIRLSGRCPEEPLRTQTFPSGHGWSFVVGVPISWNCSILPLPLDYRRVRLFTVPSLGTMTPRGRRISPLPINRLVGWLRRILAARWTR